VEDGNVESARFQEAAQEVAYREVVVDDQYRGSHGEILAGIVKLRFFIYPKMVTDSYPKLPQNDRAKRPERPACVDLGGQALSSEGCDHSLAVQFHERSGKESVSRKGALAS
jgi:hypothetical protein